MTVNNSSINIATSGVNEATKVGDNVNDIRSKTDPLVNEKMRKKLEND